MTCTKCEEDFDSPPGKLGPATVCPKCVSDILREQEARQISDAELQHKLHSASVKTNKRIREFDRKSDLATEALGYKRVAGKRILVEFPK
jgi:uncharacterized Zn finger protein (UPF0148 family)